VPEAHGQGPADLAPTGLEEEAGPHATGGFDGASCYCERWNGGMERGGGEGSPGTVRPKRKPTELELVQPIQSPQRIQGEGRFRLRLSCPLRR
jgi:hypothetical protein